MVWVLLVVVVVVVVLVCEKGGECNLLHMMCWLVASVCACSLAHMSRTNSCGKGRELYTFTSRQSRKACRAGAELCVMQDLSQVMCLA